MPFHDILVETGGFGVYQRILTFGYLALAVIQASFLCSTQIFILLIPPYHFIHNNTEWITTFNESSEQEMDSCQEIESNVNETYELIYDFSLISPTYSSENNLICSDAWKMYFCHTVYWIGNIFGTAVFGIINDKYGRRRAYQCALILNAVADITTYFCKEYVFFLICRFVSAVGGGSIFSIAFILATEHSIPSKRRLNMFISSIGFAAGTISVVWLFSIVYSWRQILMIAWIPSVISIIMSYFIPESPSWLITKGREVEAVKYVQRMARINKKSISQDFIIHHLWATNEETNEKGQKISTISECTEKWDPSNKRKDVNRSFYQTFLAVLKSPNLRKRTFFLAILWLSISAGYNGMVLQFQNLPYNFYVTFSIGALVEVPGVLFAVATVDYLGRRWVNAGLLIIGGMFGIISANISTKEFIISFVMFMKLCYSAAFDITFSYSNEIIPTEIRGRILAFIRTCGGFGGAIAPSIVSLAEKDPLLPILCFGIITVLSGLLMLTLPETCHQHLPQTIEDGENYGKGQSFWLCPFLESRRRKEKPINEEKYLDSSVNPAYETDENQIRVVRIDKLITDEFKKI